MKEPGPDHPITIDPVHARVRVVWNGKTIVDTRDAIALTEASYPPVYYIPRDDADFKYFARSDRETHCPYKGDASYFSLEDGSAQAENAVWSYEHPYPAVAQIAGRLAFYPNKVDAIELLPG